MAVGNDETYWIGSKEQLEAIISPQRHQIVDCLSAEGPMSVKELAHKMCCQPSSLYHHLEILLEVGLITHSGFRLVHRRREQLYATPAPKVRVRRSLANQHPEVMNALVSSLARQMARDFAVGASHHAKIIDGDERNFGWSRMIARPSKDQMRRLNSCIAEITRIMWEGSDEGETAISLGWVLTPIE